MSGVEPRERKYSLRLEKAKECNAKRNYSNQRVCRKINGTHPTVCIDAQSAPDPSIRRVPLTLPVFEG